MEPYLSKEDLERYIPLNQRVLCQQVKKHSIRQYLKESDILLTKEFENMAKKLKNYRSAHRSIVMPYLKQPAPECFHATAGKSVLTYNPDVSIEEAIAPLVQILVTRFNETV
ncbi:hypothetical protein F5Y16DRAFT_58733 [Xylariaceae sp. FL0255]|nr:hypothetical protein F5Y16DRAFT_58733 [Xylariaceae sp. FL0255]